jgi:hypothetical protein
MTTGTTMYAVIRSVLTCRGLWTMTITLVVTAPPPFLAAPCRHALPTRSTPIPSMCGSRSPVRKPQQVRVYGGSRKAGQPSLRMPPVPEDRTLVQDTRVCGEHLATARPQPLNEGECGHALADHVLGAAKRKAHPDMKSEQLNLSSDRIHPPPHSSVSRNLSSSKSCTPI